MAVNNSFHHKRISAFDNFTTSDKKNCPTKKVRQNLLLISLFTQRGPLLQLLHAYVAKLHTLAVTAEADVTLLVEQTGVVVTIHSVGVLAAAIGSYVVALTSLADVAVNDNLAVNSNGDVITLDADLLRVPLADAIPLDALCGDDTVY
jgi:hypothetical protein